MLEYARILFLLIGIASALTLFAALLLERLAPDQVNWVVWTRAIFYAVGALWLLTVVRAARETASRSAIVRLRIVCVLAPLGILALVIAPDSGYPLWMKVEQACFGAAMLPLACMLFTPSVGGDFPKAHGSGMA